MSKLLSRSVARSTYWVASLHYWAMNKSFLHMDRRGYLHPTDAEAIRLQIRTVDHHRLMMRSMSKRI